MVAGPIQIHAIEHSGDLAAVEDQQRVSIDLRCVEHADSTSRSWTLYAGVRTVERNASGCIK